MSLDLVQQDINFMFLNARYRPVKGPFTTFATNPVLQSCKLLAIFLFIWGLRFVAIVMFKEVRYNRKLHII